MPNPFTDPSPAWMDAEPRYWREAMTGLGVVLLAGLGWTLRGAETDA